jgi:hypothetical protein
VTLTDYYGTAQTYTMTVTVPNRPPYFSDGTTTFPDVSLPINSVLNMPIPPIIDPDKTSVTLTFSHPSSTTVFMSLTSKTNFKISPTLFS